MEKDVSLASLILNKAAFWVQIHSVPLMSMRWEKGQQIGLTLGEVMPTTTVDKESGSGNFIRIRVLINITKPLCRGRLVGTVEERKHGSPSSMRSFLTFVTGVGVSHTLIRIAPYGYEAKEDYVVKISSMVHGYEQSP